MRRRVLGAFAGTEVVSHFTWIRCYTERESWAVVLLRDATWFMCPPLFYGVEYVIKDLVLDISKSVFLGYLRTG